MKERSEKNLKDAFAGESQAHMKYLNFADKASAEGFANVARLFRAASFSEQVHASNHLRTLAGIQATSENLKEAMSGEDYEVQTMYPRFIREAEEDGEKAAVTATKAAYAAEKVHFGLYEKAKQAVDKGQDLSLPQIHVCQVCGFTVEGDAPDKCPVCGAPREKFEAF